MFRYKNIVFILISFLIGGCDPCGVGIDATGQYGADRDQVVLSYSAPRGGARSYTSYVFLEKGNRQNFYQGSYYYFLDYYPFIATNTFILYGPSDTDTVFISNLDYELYDEGKCGSEVKATRAELRTTFDSTRIIYDARSNEYDITIFKP